MIETEFTPLASALGGVLIGCSAVLLMAFTGRIAGVSGFLSQLLPPYTGEQPLIRLAFIAGLIAAAPLSAFVTGSAVPNLITSSNPLLVAAGLLVGFGSVVGSGCTSGHGVCGIARLSPRSLAATAIFMATGLATVFIMRHVIGV